MPIDIGDAVLTVMGNTDKFDKVVNELLDRMERTIQAARAAWNEKKQQKPAA